MAGVRTLNQNLCAVRTNNLEEVYNIYDYRIKNMNLTPGKVGLDPTYQDISNRFLEDQSNVMDQWRHFYPEAINPFPHIMKKPLGKTD